MIDSIDIFNSHGQFILVSIPTQILMVMIPLFMRFLGLCTIKKRFDNAHPRLYLAALENEALMNDRKSKFVLRCHACHLNCIEDCIIWWPAAIVTLLFSGVKYLGVSLTGIHLCLRFIYVILYCCFDSKFMSYIRSSVWFLGWCCPMIMLIESVVNIG